ncbi:MAG: recombination mediator RecR [Candidatus Cloacimonadales bacterium]
MIKIIEDLKDALKTLPGIGEKSAQRLALYILSQDKETASQLGETIINSIALVQNCQVCNMLTDINPCVFCSDPTRSDKQLCIVENTADVFMVESTNEFSGKYFVLSNLLSPIDGFGPSDIHIDELLRRIYDFGIEEVIIALSPSVEGETTISYIADRLADWQGNISRLSTGLPFGGDLEYSNKITIANALKHRFNVK